MQDSPPVAVDLKELLDEPGGAGAFENAAGIFANLEKSPPTPTAIATITDHPLTWAALGFADRGRQLLRRWRRSGHSSPSQLQAEAIFHVTVAPSSAAAFMREVGAPDPQLAALSVINHLYRGELRAAISISEAEGWFLDDDSLAHGLFHTVWALAMDKQFDLGSEIMVEWRRRNPQPSGNAQQFALRVEAGLASWRNQHYEAETLLDEALAICREHELGLALAYVEASAVSARARAGNIAAARALACSWPPSRQPARGPLEGFRAVALLELELLDNDLDEATRAGERALRFFEATGNRMMACFIRLRLVLAAPRSRFLDALDQFRSVVRRCPIAHYAEPLALLEELAAKGHLSARDVAVVLRCRHRRRELPMVRLWAPPVVAVGADLFLDQVKGVLHVRGTGPHSLARLPIICRALEAILESESFAVSYADFFKRVWNGEYDAIRNEGKVHVTVHRLRKTLEGFCSGAGDLIEVSDGTIAVAERADVQILEPVGEAQARPGTVRERVLQCLRGGLEPLAAGELERSLSVSRSAINTALRHLVADGLIERRGLGRATRYARI